MKIETGKQSISLSVLAAILSLSLVVNLPGLAVTPMLAQLKSIFPHSTQFEEQLLTLIPNLLIFPFILLSGRLSLSRHKLRVVGFGLVLFTLSAGAYFLCRSMWSLIVVSAFLGAAAGLLIPFSTGLISDTFAGKYRTKEMGIQSGISNLTLVVATFAVGLLATGDWHLPFIVYLVAVIPLAMLPLLKKIPKSDESGLPLQTYKPVATGTTEKNVSPLRYSKTWSTLGLYFLITFLTVIVTLYTPYLIQRHNWSSTLAGTVTSAYFLFIFLPGFGLPYIIKWFKSWTIVASAMMICAGLAFIAFIPDQGFVILGASLCGLGYGIIQPLMYDKATKIIPDPQKSTETLSIVLSANYLAIVVTPEIIDGFRALFGYTANFPFVFNFCISIGMVILAVLCRGKFAFHISKDDWTE